MLMDLFIYLGILVVLGFSRVNATSNVSDEVSIADTTTVPNCDLPIGNNLQMSREVGAYTLILRQLRLM